jgi:hypothetical protein
MADNSMDKIIELSFDTELSVDIEPLQKWFYYLLCDYYIGSDF